MAELGEASIVQVGDHHQCGEGWLALARPKILNDCAGLHTHVCAQGAALEVIGDLAAEPQQIMKL